MTYVDPSTASDPTTADLIGTADSTGKSLDKLSVSASSFAKIMAKAFSDATTGGKQFDTVLKSLAVQLSKLALQQALKPAVTSLSGGLNDILGGILGGGSISMNAMGAIKPFASGGVIGAPTYFPLSTGGLGLAGEAGPEAIVPLTRGADGRLGVAFSGSGAAPNVTVQIATPDAGSFRRSEAYITGQIARAVARGQRSL